MTKTLPKERLHRGRGRAKEKRAVHPEQRSLQSQAWQGKVARCFPWILKGHHKVKGALGINLH